jgi:hypothetical protein
VKDGEYVQFFRAIATADDLLKLDSRPANDWWMEFIEAAAEEIERLVTSGSLQPTTPSVPMLLRPDVAEAHRRSRLPDPGRRHVTATEPALDGVDVHRFGEGEFTDRRRAPRS